MKRYRLGSPADRDLDEIWDHIAEDNPTAADRVIDSLHEKFRLLTNHPDIGRECDELAPGLHRFSAGSHVIFYRIARRHIEIARILHGARDIEAIFEEKKSE